MKKKLSFVFMFFAIMLTAFFGIVCFGNAKSVTFANAADEVGADNAKASRWLLSNEEPYQSTRIAGQTVGYGRFLLNEKNVLLSTSANAGYALVGWRVQYTLNGGIKTIFIHNENTYVFEDVVAPDENPVKIDLTYFDKDGDGYYDNGGFTISNIFCDMTVDAVFDFIYNNVDVSAIFDYTTFSEYASQTVGDKTVYYSSKTDGEETFFENAFLKQNDRVLYFKDLYSNGDSVYRKFNDFAINGEVQNVDASRGAFRLDENIDLTFVMKTASVIDDSVNLSVYDCLVACNGVSYSLVNNINDWSCEIVTDNERTQSVAAKFNILFSTDQTLTISFDAENLYVATINIFVDEQADGSDYITNSIEMVRENISIRNAQPIKQTNNKYFVKSGSRFGSSLEVYCPDVNGESLSYKYYTFSEMTLENIPNEDEVLNNNFLKMTTISNNFAVNVKYASYKYTITMVAYLYYNDELTELKSVNVNNASTSVLRGTTKVFNKNEVESNLSNDLGYEFYGFSTSEQNRQQITIKIDELRPENKTIMLVFVYKNYTLKLTNYNKLSINDKYPINNLDVAINGLPIANLTSRNLKDAGTIYSFGRTLHLGDEVSFNALAERGFAINGFYIGNKSNQYSTTTTTFKFVVDKEFLSSLSIETDIVVNIVEDYATFTLTYYIDQSMDSVSKTMVTMADISVQEIEGATYSYFYENDENEYSSLDKAKTLRQIVVKNLKLNQEIAIYATSREMTYAGESGPTNYSFRFVRFTANNKSDLLATHTEKTYSHTALIDSDKTIRVVYAAQTSQILIAVNEYGVNAFETEDFNSNINLFQQGIRKEIDADHFAEIQLGEFSVNIVGTINFGYKLTSYTLTQGEEETNYDYQNATQSFIIGSIDNLKLTLNFSLVKFYVSVRQTGEGYVQGDDGFVYSDNINNAYQFGDGTEKEINVENCSFTVLNIQGSFVSHFYFQNSEILDKPDFRQDNSTTQNYLTIAFSPEEMKAYFEPYASAEKVVVEIRLVYSLHTYSIKAEFKINDYTGESIVLPAMNLTYTFNNVEFNVSPLVQDFVYTFENVRYGVDATISLLSALPKGYTYGGWDLLTDKNITKGENFIKLPYVDLNMEVVYKINYKNYVVDVRIDGNASNRGTPEVFINERLQTGNTKNIYAYNGLRILFNANREQGFEFVALYYYADFACDEQQFNEYDGNIYEFNAETNNFELATEYQQGNNYYTQKCYDESEEFIVEHINLNDFATVNDNEIRFYIVYEYIQVNITHSNELLGEAKLSGVGDLEINLDYLAQYIVTKNGQELSFGETVTYDDTIEIYVYLNSVAINNTDNYRVDLWRGVELFSIKGLNIDFTSGSIDGSYIIKFSMSSLFNFVDADNNLNLVYLYSVQTRSVELSTNVTTPEFYRKDNETKFYYQVETTKGFVGEDGRTVKTTQDSGEMSISYSLQFLGAADLSFKFTSQADKDSFVVKTVEFYSLASGEPVLISPDDYSIYGIYFDTENLEKISLRFVDNLKIVLKVEPLVYFNKQIVKSGESYNFTNKFQWYTETSDEHKIGDAKPQPLSVGVYSRSSNANIEASDIISNRLIVNYFDAHGDDCVPTNKGEYVVKISFDATGEYSWLQDVELSYNVYYRIEEKHIRLSYTPFTLPAKVYDGGNNYLLDAFSEYLYVVDRDDETNSVNYERDFKIENLNFKFGTSSGGRVIAYIARGLEVTKDVGDGLNLLLYAENFVLVDDEPYNSNFILDYDTIQLEPALQGYLFASVVSIKPAQIEIRGFKVNNRVYEKGNTSVGYTLSGTNQLSGALPGDDVYVNLDNLILRFEDDRIGLNKKIIINYANALAGEDAHNYVLSIGNYTASIYPYSVSVYIAGIGDVVVQNDRGKTDPELADLIPIDAKLEASVFYNDSAEYRDIYPLISNYMSYRVLFAIGYKFNFVVGEQKQPINKYLYISFPKIERLENAIWITRNESGRIQNVADGERVVIDLSETSDNDIDGIVFFQNRQYFTWWQILIIVLLFLILIVVLILWYVHERRKQKQRDELNETI